MTILKTCDLTIIIPIHNIEDYIGYCLDTILAQRTKYTYEIICVFDDCEDNSKNIVNEKLKDSDYTAIDVNVHSCGSARNFGLDIAKGKYIWFIDGDDWLVDEKAIDIILDSFDEYTDIVHFRYQSQGYNFICYEMVWQYVYRFELIKDLKFGSQMPQEDLQFNAALQKKNPNIKKIETIIYHYNFPRENSVMYHYFRKLGRKA